MKIIVKCDHMIVNINYNTPNTTAMYILRLYCREEVIILYLCAIFIQRPIFTKTCSETLKLRM